MCLGSGLTLTMGLRGGGYSAAHGDPRTGRRPWASRAAHLLKLAQAMRLLDAEAIITGIEPSVAPIMVTLGMDLGAVTTLETLREALRFCMMRMRDKEA